jgi:hypothetical protein
VASIIDDEEIILAVVFEDEISDSVIQVLLWILSVAELEPLGVVLISIPEYLF